MRESVCVPRYILNRLISGNQIGVKRLISAGTVRYEDSFAFENLALTSLTENCFVLW